jgi:hypothetical protein
MGGYVLSHYPLSPAIRHRLNLCAGCGLTLAILLMAVTCWATTYRWVDEHGTIHYGDSMPPQYAGVGHQELDAQGRVIRRVESASRMAADKEALARKAAEEQTIRAQQQHDNALLSTFGSSQEIDQTRDRVLAQEQALLNGLLVIRKQNQTPADAARLDAMILRRYKNLELIRSQFDADKARYRELTGKP